MMRRLYNLGLSAWILIGLLLGAFCGLFFGELCAPRNFLGNAFIKLLQMGVLPYMVFSLIHGVASPSREDAKLMGARGSMALLLFWALGLTVISGFSLAFPDPHYSRGSHFSRLFEQLAKSSTDILGAFLPV